jgi:hypothetical protein
MKWLARCQMAALETQERDAVVQAAALGISEIQARHLEILETQERGAVIQAAALGISEIQAEYANAATPNLASAEGGAALRAFTRYWGPNPLTHALSMEVACIAALKRDLASEAEALGLAQLGLDLAQSRLEQVGRVAHVWA